MGNGTSVTEWDCATCGKHCSRPPTKGQRPKYCSEQCRVNGRDFRIAVCVDCGKAASKGCTRCGACYRALPRTSPDDLERRRRERQNRRNEREKQARKLVRATRLRSSECEWCGAAYTTDIPTQRFCCDTCKAKAKRTRRRGRASGWASHYTWAEVIKVFIANDKRCAYCEMTIDGQPDPDHVVPLSKGGSNSITNILPCCRPCNSDKRDLSLDEWAVDRKRRGLPSVITHWSSDSPVVAHLTSIEVA